MDEIIITIYTKADCPLCDKAKSIIEAFRPGFNLRIDLVDITASELLAQEYGTQIPVVFINGRKVFKHRVPAPDLERKLMEASAAARGG